MKTLLDVIDEGRRYGRRPALLIKPGFRTRVWSYDALADLVPKAAAVLRGAGLEPGARVIIWAVNRPEWPIAYFAALHAGLVLVPLDFRTLADFAAKVAERTGAVAVLASQQTAPEARKLGLPLLLIERLPDLARERAPLARAPIGPDDLVEIVFTSGTTGDPKGAMLTHANILSNAVAAQQVFPLGPKQRLLSLLPLSHMFEQMAGLIAPLVAGSSIAYPSSRQPSVIFRSFRDLKITMVLVAPQVLRLFDNAISRQADASGKREALERLHRWARPLPLRVRRLLFTSVHRRLGGRLRYIVSGGAALDPDLGMRWQDMGIDVLEGYGATECAPGVSFNRLDKRRWGTVGIALPGVEVELAGDGEVLVRGPNVFPGYWRDPDATAAVLTDGWYHTGDLGSFDAEGFLTLRGRKKDMIVLSDGTNVFPEDIETALQHDGRVKDATVIGLDRPGEDVHVHAVLLLNDAADADAVVDAVNRSLSSSQQIRGHSVWADEDFPRTHTLKVKKRDVLARITATGVTPAAPGPVDPSLAHTDVERIVAQVSPTPHELRSDARLSNDLGLDSLGRIELLGVIEEELGVYIDDATVTPDTTVAELEGMVTAARDTPREPDVFGWPLHPLVRTFGLLLQEFVIWPFITVFYRIRVDGREKLRDLHGPVLFAPNHCLHYDNGIILTSIPLGWRWHLAIAAAADDIFGNRLRGFFSALLAGAFPLAREGAIRRSLELLGARLDRDFSVLIYPEGKLTVGGPIQPFKAGTGLIAVEGVTPVVPMRLKIGRMSVLDRIGWPLRGSVEVVFGDPITFASDTDPNEATERLQAAVAAL